MFFSTPEEKLKKLAENFDRHLLICMEREQPLLDLMKKDYMYKTRMLNSLFEKDAINYWHVSVVARAIKSDTELSKDGLMSYDFDRSLFYDLFSLTFRIVLTPLTFLVALCTQPSQSYLVLKICAEEILRLVSVIIFPFALLYSKYKTDSFNVSKGVASRMLDRIIALAETLATDENLYDDQVVSKSFDDEQVEVRVNLEEVCIIKNQDPHQDDLQQPGTVAWALSSASTVAA